MLIIDPETVAFVRYSFYHWSRIWIKLLMEMLLIFVLPTKLFLWSMKSWNWLLILDESMPPSFLAPEAIPTDHQIYGRLLILMNQIVINTAAEIKFKKKVH